MTTDEKRGSRGKRKKMLDLTYYKNQNNK